MAEHQPSKLVTRVRFPSPAPHAIVAQSVEQLICNQQVGGSSPSGGSKLINFRIYTREEVMNLNDTSVQNPTASLVSDGVLTCRWCGTTGHKEAFDLHPSGFGFWCDCCGFTFFDEREHDKRRLLLLLEDKQAADPHTFSSSPLPHLRKQLSPLRYPGGKSKLIDYLYSQLCQDQLDTFVEVFAGGASLGLSLLDANVVHRLILNDKSLAVYSFWKTVLECPQELISRLQGPLPTHRDLEFAKTELALRNDPTPDLAWSFLLSNRLSYSGIVMANPLGGKNGSQEALLSRWNPKKLEDRILHIHSMRKRIELYNEDCFDFIENKAWWSEEKEGRTIFLDPPYFLKGPKLYPLAFTKEDHCHLAELLEDLYREFPCADIILTYDNTPYIRALYPFAEQRIINRRYSI